MIDNSNEKDGSWDCALKCSKKVGYIPAAFSEAVRLLVNDQFSNNRQLKPVSKYQIARVLRGPNFKSMLYYASQSLARDIVSSYPSLTVGEMMGLFEPLDLACMISSLVLARKIRREVPEALWNEMLPHLRRETTIGGYVGVALPSVGFAPGILWGSMPHLSHVLLASSDPSSYTKYRRALAAGHRTSDPKLELSLWGATASQVSSVILTQLGFGKQLSAQLDQAASYSQGITTISDESLKKLRLGLLWFECLALGKPQPTEQIPTKLHPFKTDKDRVESYLKQMKNTDVSWIERSGADISKEKTPQLFEEVKGDPKFEIPTELKEVFTLKEITTMDEWDFDKLVDHIDLEAEESQSKEILATKDLKELESMTG